LSARNDAEPVKNIVVKFTRWLAPLAVVLVTFGAFLPALQNGFVDLDDDTNFLNNANYRGLAWNQIRWMFTTFHMGHYQPLSWMTLGADYLFWGMDASGYHLTNVVLHSVNALIFYFVCLRLLKLSIPGAKDLPGRAAAAAAALLFAIHPLRVESVAWITERRDVLSAAFFLLTLLAYLNAATAETRTAWLKWLSASIALYALSLLSKATGMTLPVVLLLLDIYVLKRLGGGRGSWRGRDARSVWIEKVPFVVLAVVAAVVAALAQQSIGAMVSLARYGVAERAAQVFYGLVFYLWRTLVPSGLSPLYEVPRNFSPWEPMYAAAAVLVVGLSAALFFLRRRWAAVWAAWVYYIVMLLPVSGIAQSGSQLVADRYSYLSCLGWCVLAAGGVYLLWSRDRRSRTVASAAAAAAICVSLAFLTWRQAQIWHDSETLLTYVLAHDPNSRIAQNNLGNLLYHRGKVDEAIARYRKAIDSNPYYDYTYGNLAVALASQGKTDEAIAMYRTALGLNPRFTTARVRLAELLVRTGRNDDAISEFRKAVELEPSSSEAHHRWGNALMRAGDWGAAAEQYREALKTDPKNLELRTNLGGALAALNQDSAAIAEYRATLEVEPNYISARYNLGLLLAENGDVPGAIQNLRRVLELSPDDADAHYHLGRLLTEQGQGESAAEELKRALKLRPQWPEAEARLKALARAPAR
jgi:protein O-mannosyl-transferase